MPISKINLTSGITGVLPSANATYSTARKNAKPNKAAIGKRR